MLSNEYLRRNRLHAASVGVYYGIKSILERIDDNWSKKPLWLVQQLNVELEKADRIHKEMAFHRDEVSPNSEDGGSNSSTSASVPQEPSLHSNGLAQTAVSDNTLPAQAQTASNTSQAEIAAEINRELDDGDDTVFMTIERRLLKRWLRLLLP